MKFPWLAAFLLLLGCGQGSEDQLTVYAAASLSDFAEELSAQSPQAFSVRTESSGSLAQEIAHGAPAHLFLSADSRWIDYLEEQQRIAVGSRTTLAGNRLVVAVSGETRASHWSDLPGLRNVAMGEPASVPAGRYAQEALAAAGLWETLASKLVFARNVRAALALLEQGEVDAAIVYASDMTVARNARIAFTIPWQNHSPIGIEFCVIEGAPSESAGRLARFLHSSKTRELLEKHGFLPAP